MGHPLQPAAIVMVPSGEGRWLTVTRPEPPHEAALPGGFVEPGESALAAAARELFEETAVGATQLERVGVGAEEGRRVDVFLARGWANEPRSVEGRGAAGRVRWMTWPELRAQAQRFGGFLDGLRDGFRVRYGRDP